MSKEKQLYEILRNLQNGKIGTDKAHIEILRLFSVSGSYDKPDWSNGCDCGQMSCITCHG